MISELKAESENLRRSWDRHPSKLLDDYLVINHEDPRINLKSILTRAFIVDILWPGEFNDLISDELRYGAVLSWLVQQLNNGIQRYSLLNSISQLESTLPGFIPETYQWLESDDCPIPNYISDALSRADPDRPERLLNEQALGTFETLWPLLLETRTAELLPIIEFGPGSANDYRYLESFGLARFLQYSGIDISEKNIENARSRCPSATFSVGNIFDSHLPDNCTDYVLANDLFEHFSPAGLEVSIKQAMRVCKKEAWLHFFNAADIEQHEIQPVGDYFWNKLSIKKLVESIGKYASRVEVVIIGDMLNTKFGYENFYNAQAVTMIASK